ncbi:MAG: DNA-protecting protein DprA, partial [Candidatus Omnitrophica bacterium]|nr:DNA-protecting protein DprA [Candidatus Omnitrophota bacterium]
LTILSGFARGIDRQAHEGALEISYGRTIAVLGSGMDVIYPKEHGKLFEKIKERGAILTEYPLGTDPKAYHFPRRNRIISGLSLGVLVVEAHLRSGSLITAYESAETGREVFSIPGPVDQLTSRGTHRLIKEGAALVENPSEILENLAERLWPIIGITSVIASPPKADEAISKIETDAISKARLLRPYGARNDDTENILLEMLAQKPLSYEEILSGKILSPPELARQMIELEAKKKIRRNLDGRFTLI